MKNPGLLFARWLAFNVMGFAALMVAWHQGWLAMVIAADITGIVWLIAALFLWGLGVCGWRTAQVSREIDFIKERPGRMKPIGDTLKVYELRLAARILVIRRIASTLVMLGLIGTVVGFIIALSGVSPDVVGNPAAVGPMVANLITGLGIALYTTLVGAVAHLWLMATYHMLRRGTATLLAAVIQHA